MRRRALVVVGLILTGILALLDPAVAQQGTATVPPVRGEDLLKINLTPVQVAIMDRCVEKNNCLIFKGVSPSRLRECLENCVEKALLY